MGTNNGNNEGERLANLEGKFDMMLNLVTKMDAKLDTWNKNYVPRQELNEMFRSRDEKITDVNTELDRIKKEKQSNKALWPAWGAVVIATLALLLKFL